MKEVGLLQVAEFVYTYLPPRRHGDSAEDTKYSEDLLRELRDVVEAEKKRQSECDHLTTKLLVEADDGSTSWSVCPRCPKCGKLRDEEERKAYDEEKQKAYEEEWQSQQLMEEEQQAQEDEDIRLDALREEEERGDG